MYCPAITTCVSLAFSVIVCIYCFLTNCSDKGILRVKAKMMGLNWKDFGSMTVQGLPYFINAVPSMFGIMLINTQMAKHASSPEEA